jgi:hypothetical protein
MQMQQPGRRASAGFVHEAAAAAPPLICLSLGSAPQRRITVEDWLLYHKPKVMGAPPERFSPPELVSDSKADVNIGDRVWLISGIGKPAQFGLWLVMRVRMVDHSGPGWGTKMTGRDEKWFDHPPLLNHQPWFDDFRTKHGNFAFGLQKLKDPKFLPYLEALL